MIIAGNKLYDTCYYCGKLIQINKRFFGSLHVCNKPPINDTELQSQVDQQLKFMDKKL